MPNWKDDADYERGWGKARDGMNAFPPNSQHAGQFAEGWGHVFRNPVIQQKRTKDEGLSLHLVDRPIPPPRPHAEGETVAPPVRPARTPAWQRGLVQGMMWRRRNPRYY